MSRVYLKDNPDLKRIEYIYDATGEVMLSAEYFARFNSDPEHTPPALDSNPDRRVMELKAIKIRK